MSRPNCSGDSIMRAATISGMAEIRCCAVTATVSPFALSSSHTSIRPSESGLIFDGGCVDGSRFLQIDAVFRRPLPAFLQTGMTAQVFRKMCQTFGPSEDGFRAVAGGKIMQSGKGRHLPDALSVIVSATIIEIPQKARTSYNLPAQAIV